MYHSEGSAMERFYMQKVLIYVEQNLHILLHCTYGESDQLEKSLQGVDSMVGWVCQ